MWPWLRSGSRLSGVGAHTGDTRGQWNQFFEVFLGAVAAEGVTLGNAAAERSQDDCCPCYHRDTGCYTSQAALQ